MKKSFYLFLTFIFIGFIASSYFSQCQITRKWIVVDTSERDRNTSYIPFPKSMAAANKNSIILCSQLPTQDKFIEHIKNEGKEINEIYRKKNAFFEHWNSVAHPSSDVIVVVGDSVYEYYANTFVKIKRRMMIISRDGGESWQKVVGDSNTYFADVSMCDSVFGAVLHRYTSNKANDTPAPREDSLWLTDDCWKTIKKVPLPNDSDSYLKVFCFTRKKYALLTWSLEQSYINFTSDGGESWYRSENIGNDVSVRNITFAGNAAYAVGYDELVPSLKYPVLYRSQDDGITWSEVKSIYNDSIYSDDGYMSMDFFDEMNGIIGVEDGTIRRTSNGGETWSTEFTPNIDGKRGYLEQVYYPCEDFAIGTSDGVIIKSGEERCLAIPGFKHILNMYDQPLNNVKLEWTKIKGAEEYQIRMRKSNKNKPDDTSSFNNPWLDTTLSGNSITLNGLDDSTFYYAWIRALDDGLESDWSDEDYVFMTDAKDSLYFPDLIYPVHNSMNVPTNITVRWTKVPAATSYILNVNYDYDEFWDVYNYIEDTTVTLEGLLPNRVYRLELKSVGESSKTKFCGFKFITGDETAVNEARTDFSDIKVYPNPVNDICRIFVFADKPATGEVIVSNLYGMEVLNYDKLLKAGENNIKIDLSRLPMGVYIIKLRTNDGLIGVSKIMKN